MSRNVVSFISSPSWYSNDIQLAEISLITDRISSIYLKVRLQDTDSQYNDHMKKGQTENNSYKNTTEKRLSNINPLKTEVNLCFTKGYVVMSGFSSNKVEVISSQLLRSPLCPWKLLQKIYIPDDH